MESHTRAERVEGCFGTRVVRDWLGGRAGGGRAESNILLWLEAWCGSDEGMCDWVSFRREGDDY